MDIFTLAFWLIGIVLFVIAIVKKRDKAIAAMGKSRRMMGSMMSDIVAVILLIGLVLTIIPPETIKKLLGTANVWLASAGAALAGSVTLIPAFVAFPLVGSLVDAGASVVPAVAFLTTLTMVGVVTFPLEKKEFGLKFAVMRNTLSFVFAIGIAMVMGVIL